MVTRAQWQRFVDHPAVEWTIFGVGITLMVISPLAGVLPGPGGILLFALGLGMVLRTSMWAKRHYARFKRKQPKAGEWVDWGLRRPSAKRRHAVRKEASGATGDDPANIGQAPVQPPGAAPVDVPSDPWPEPEAKSH